LARYGNPNTRKNYESQLAMMIRYAGTHDVHSIGPEHLVPWLTAQGLANNTIRKRMATVKQFYAWARRQGITTNDPVAEIEHLRKSYPTTYGRVQATNKGRWLTADEAFGSLVAQCQDGTNRGRRDEVIIRLGLAGMRRAEVMRLTWDDLHLHHTPPSIGWTAKGNRPRTVVPGAKLIAALDAWRQAWTEARGEPPSTAAIIRATSRVRAGGPKAGVGDVNWDRPADTHTVYKAILRRSEAAGLGHVAPHDLRRTAAGILHTTLSTDGGHLFDLVDVQRVLGHASPETTQRSYIDPIDHEVTQRAASVLD